MNCNSRHSFKLYFSRFSNLIDKWISFLKSDFLYHVDDKEKECSGIKEKWKRFKEIVGYIKIEIEVSVTMGIIYRFQYAHAVFSGLKMGLGP